MPHILPDHHCQLSGKGRRIYLSKREHLLMNLRNIFSLWENHYQVNLYFQSNAAALYEKNRHQKGPHPWIIHPFSKCAMVREICCTTCWMMMFVLDPFGIAFEIDKVMIGPFLLYVNMLPDLLLCVECVLNFFTGYVLEQTKEVIDDPISISKRYLTTYFLFDLLGSIPTAEMLMIWDYNDRTYIAIAEMFHMLRFVRFRTVLTTIRRILYAKGCQMGTYSIVTIFFVVLYMVHMFNCLQFAIPRLLHVFRKIDPQTWYERALNDYNHIGGIILHYCIRMHVTLSLFTLTDNVRQEMSIHYEYVIGTIILMCGLVTLVCVFATSFCLVSGENVSETNFKQLIKQVDAMCIDKNLDKDFQRRVKLYLKVFLCKKVFDMELLFADWSQSIKNDVIMYNYTMNVKELRMFNSVSRITMDKLLRRASKEYFLEDELIFSASECIDCIYIISYGKVALFFDNGVEWCHRRDGDVIGEVAYINEGVPMVSVRTIETSELFAINMADINNVGGETVLVKSLLRTHGQSTLHKILSMTSGHFKLDYVHELTKSLQPKSRRDNTYADNM